MVAEKVDYYLCVKCVEHAQCYSEMKCKEEEDESLPKSYEPDQRRVGGGGGKRWGH